MAQCTLKDFYKVNIIESERGWKTEVIEKKYFETESEAKEFCREFNGKLLDEVPDYYIIAQYIGKVS